uniref:Uncharacterized protein n=1 Tax=Oryza meridionalis TaxID=40149 RepID=A0A0E0CF03_9ORYZ
MVPRGAALGRGGGVDDEHPRDGEPEGDGFPGEREGEEEERVVEAEVGGGELRAEEVEASSPATAAISAAKVQAEEFEVQHIATRPQPN